MKRKIGLKPTKSAVFSAMYLFVSPKISKSMRREEEEEGDLTVRNEKYENWARTIDFCPSQGPRARVKTEARATFHY